MIAREAVLNDPHIVKLLRDNFVCIAVDNADNLNLTPADKVWLKDRGGNACTQGMSVFTVGGVVLGKRGGYQPRPVQKMLEEALAKYEPEKNVEIEDTTSPAIAAPPEGGLVLNVTWKLLPGAKPQPSATSGNGTYDQTFLDSLGVDRLWVRRDEAEALASGKLPDSLRRRMAPHLTKVLPGGIATDDLVLSAGRLAGTYRSKQGDRAVALGLIEASDGKVKQFQLIVKGYGVRATDHGFSAGLTVIPKNERTPVALCFSLADPNDDMSRMPPYRSRGKHYLQ